MKVGTTVPSDDTGMPSLFSLTQSQHRDRGPSGADPAFSAQYASRGKTRDWDRVDLGAEPYLVWWFVRPMRSVSQLESRMITRSDCWQVRSRLSLSAMWIAGLRTIIEICSPCLSHYMCIKGNSIKELEGFQGIQEWPAAGGCP